MNRRLYRDVADRIAAAIREGRFGRGQRLPAQRDLAGEFEVSRQTIREALTALECQGLVSVRRGLGAWVSDPPSAPSSREVDADPIEIIEARRSFEGEAAALAACAITTRQLRSLERLAETMADAARAEDADRAFHTLIAEATHNTIVASVVAQLQHQYDGALRGAGVAERPRVGGSMQPGGDHLAIVRALRKRDPACARDAMRALLDNALRGVHDAAELHSLVRARRDRDNRGSAVTRARLRRASRRTP